MERAVSGLMEVRALGSADVRLVATIDRSEHVDIEYRVVDGRLEQFPARIADVPAWDRVGDGPHSVAMHVEFCRSVVEDGGVLLGCFDGDRPAGLAIVQPSFEPHLAWLAFLHVSRPYRRQGVGQALWSAACEIAASGDADAVYVSATNTGSAVGFYLRQGCRLARPAHPGLFAMEPEDIHLTCPLPRR